MIRTHHNIDIKMKTKQNNRIRKFGSLAVLLLGLLIGTSTQAQQITGPTSVNEGTVNNYSLSGASNISWNVSGAASWSGSGSSISVTAGSTNYTVSANFTGGSGYSALFVTVTPSGPTPPSTPPTPTVANFCDYTRLTRATPPSGVTYYWQSSSGGTSTSNSSSYVDRVNGSTYYLRARGNSSGLWSNSRSVSYTIDYAPSAPLSPTVTNNCGSTVLTRSNPNPTANVTWYWQNSATGTSTSNTATSVTRTSGTVYYLRARSNSNNCWGPARTVNYTINTLPSTPTAPSVSSNDCGSTVLSRSNPPSGITWYWQSSSSGTSTSNSNQTITRSSGTVYYLRARNNSTQCWSSSSASINYSIDSPPPTPTAPTVSANNCDNTVLARTSPPSGITWYWQDTASGVSTANSASTITRTNGTVQYLRAKLNSSDCWSVASASVNYTIDYSPSAPLSPTVTNNCGNTVLTRSDPNPTANVTWYWQTEATGTNTAAANSATSVTLTSGSLYYLRARTNGTSCWGPARTINYTINAVPLEASGSNVARCGTGTVTLTASPGTNGDEIRWYTAASGGSPLTTGVSANTLEYTTPSISATTTYYAETYNSTTGCFSTTRHALEAQITSGIDWYADTDNDGFRDPGSVAEQDCNARGAGWTQNIEEDLCPSNFSITNVVPTWYLDMDNDNHASSQTTSCGSPGSGWKQGPLPVDDCNDNIYSIENDCSAGADANPLDQNYVYTRNYQEARNTVPDQKFDEGGNGLFDVENEYVQDITYFDGLGRPMQQVGIRQSPDNEKDIVTHIGYDAYGRQDKEWLPLHEPDSTIGSYRYWDMEGATKQYYKTHPVYDDDFTGLLEADVNAYSQKHFEPSPMNRVLRQAAPGEDWKLNVATDDRSIEFDYTSNDTLQVRLFRVDLTAGLESPALAGADDGFYAPGELYRNVTKDENHDTADDKLHTTEEFMDKQGRVVLKRTYADADIDLNGNGNNTDPNEILQAPHDTYYIYDDYGNLTYVLPPKIEAGTATLAEINTDLAELGYQYVYDNRNRLVEKQLPGKGREYIIYNKLDQPIMTQDSIQRVTGEWLFTKYDIFGRVAYTGKATDGRNRDVIQGDVDALTVPLWVVPTATVDSTNDFGGTTVYYNNGAYPITTLTEILTINYYDNYDFDRASTGETATALGVASDPDVKGLATGSKIKVLDVTGPDVWITTVNYYDDKGRQIYGYSNNAYLGTVDIVENLLDFTGKPLRTKTTHTRNSVTIVTIDNFSYDATGRLLAQTQCIGDETLGDSCTGGATANLPLSGTISDSQVATTSITVTNATLVPGARLYIDPNATGTSGSEELIAYNDYDELGLLVHKKVGGTPSSAYATSQELQEVDYDYNVRGWLTGINDSNTADNDLTLSGDDLFGFRINYNDPKDFGSGHNPDALFNGNIAQTLWKTGSVNPNPPNNPVSERYSYTYDALNRIGSAVDNTGNYNLSGVTYDKNGNILSLNRQGHTNAGATSFGTMDRLTYVYTGNQLDLVEDDDSLGNNDYGFVDGTNTGDDFAYDGNGNMTSDLNKGIQADGIIYNHLNLPTEVKFDNNNLKKITYIYDANGNKLVKTANDNGSLTNTEYAGNYIYENSTLQFFNHPEGYVEPNGSGGYHYVYQYKDQVGNVRLSYKDISVTSTPNLEIQEENNYYPFGLKHKGYNTVQNGRDHKFEYNSVEMETSLGYNMMEMDMRHYDPAIGRFSTMDPVTHHQYSPYQGYDNNPVFWSDPSGADSEQDNSQQTFFHSSYLNRNGGHWSDQVKSPGTTNNNGQGDEQDSTQENQKKKEDPCKNKNCPEKIDFNDPKTIKHRIIMWGRFFRKHPESVIHARDILIQSENNDDDLLTRLGKKLLGWDDHENKKRFKIDGTIVDAFIELAYYNSPGDDGYVNYVSDKHTSVIPGTRTRLYHISFMGLTGQTRGSGYRHQILVFRFHDPKVRSKIMSQIKNDSFEEKVPDGQPTIHINIKPID
ncbi:DUF6443 domain-containing protein [Ulvibacterium sp.]|uniref:DUF6443 domain-containing protein n=1 Tax=Ulvibacterium sp. TaxID=2665914 RepID=UPI0026042AA3|nr:DUF6443 domain-containing protein [Ulvibacterium sp.]